LNSDLGTNTVILRCNTSPECQCSAV